MYMRVLPFTVCLCSEVLFSWKILNSSLNSESHICAQDLRFRSFDLSPLLLAITHSYAIAIYCDVTLGACNEFERTTSQCD